jgi:hypothetical protein
MTSKHTPGPWDLNCTHLGVDGETWPADIVASPAGSCDPLCTFPFKTTTDRSSSENLANGRLIAAAPEMYEALKHLALFSGDLSDIGDQDRLRSLFAMSRRAIAKAEGRS